jgi:hypothetical protein
MAQVNQFTESKSKRAYSISDPTYTVNEFCAAERISRSMLYTAWKAGWGPDFYLVGVTRRITHRARLAWHAEREAAARSGKAA